MLWLSVEHRMDAGVKLKKARLDHVSRARDARSQNASLYRVKSCTGRYYH